MSNAIPYANCGIAGSILRKNYWSKDKEVAVLINNGKKIACADGERWLMPDCSVIERNGRSWNAAPPPALLP